MKKEYLNEIWKPIKGYEGLYEVSNLGRVKSIRFGKERILKPGTDKRGYLHVVLSKNNKQKTHKVHRLVMEAFIPNTDNLPCVNHKDEDKTNNVDTNLEWCDAKYNQNYGTRIERIAEKLSKTVLQYDLEGNFIREWKSSAECGRNGFNQGAVAACCRGERQQAYGYKWVYKKCL